MRTSILLLVLVGCDNRPDVGPDPSGTGPSTAVGTTDDALKTDCGKAGFAAGTEGLSGPDLWTALTTLTSAQTCSSYETARLRMFTVLDKVDGSVTCVYTGRSTPVGGSEPDATDMNTEHTWPQSEGADVNPARCDLHHLYPSDADANNRRGSFPFGDVVGVVDWFEGGSSLGEDADGITVFEPRAVHQGNVARSMLYFSARYSRPLSADQVALFKAWSAADPVDAPELARTWAIADLQILANPLVVCSDLVSRL